MLSSQQPRPSAIRGVTLVELMVALVVGLIVVGAVIALVVSIMKANRETLQTTRLNQELRATMAVITSDLRRASGVEDPMTAATAAAGTNPYSTIAIPTATPANSCITYGYFGGAGGDCRVVGLNGNMVKIATSAPVANACAGTCADLADNSKANPLGSDQVVIDTLSFTKLAKDREYQVVLTGHLNDTNPQLGTVSRTITQNVFVRSVSGN